MGNPKIMVLRPQDLPLRHEDAKIIEKSEEASVTHVLTKCTEGGSRELCVTLCVEGHRLATSMKRQY